MAGLVTQAMKQCPDSKIVMSGYSQGGQLVHNAAAQLSTATMKAVSSIVIFGDPDNGDAIPGIAATSVKTVCHTGDAICAGQDLVLAPHLTYSTDASAAADFVVGKSGLGIDD
jgi:cutinase